MGIGALVGTIILVIYQLKRPGLNAVWTLIGLGILYTLTSVSMSLYVTAGPIGRVACKEMGQLPSGSIGRTVVQVQTKGLFAASKECAGVLRAVEPYVVQE